MASLSRETVVHVARLARLELTEEEITAFSAQLSAVLEHAGAVCRLDTANVAPTSHPLPVRNVVRRDTPTPCLPREEVLAAAPESSDGYFVVPPVLGQQP